MLACMVAVVMLIVVQRGSGRVGMRHLMAKMASVAGWTVMR